MQLAFIPQGDWEVYETMDSCTCPQPTQPTRSRKNKKAQGGLINRKSHGEWSMKDSNILTTFLAHGWATSGTQTFCAFTKLANINTLLTRFFSQLLVFGLEKAQFTPKSSNISRHRMMGIFFHIFFLQQVQASGAPKWASKRRCSGDLSCWRKSNWMKQCQFREVHCTSLSTSNWIFSKLSLQSIFRFYMPFTYLYLGQTNVPDCWNESWDLQLFMSFCVVRQGCLCKCLELNMLEHPKKQLVKQN